jgi:hypothetical protein
MSFDPVNASFGFLFGVIVTTLMFVLFGMLSHFYQLADQIQEIMNELKAAQDDATGDKENGNTKE